MVPVIRSCQSPIWMWLVNYFHLHLHMPCKKKLRDVCVLSAYYQNYGLLGLGILRHSLKVCQWLANLLLPRLIDSLTGLRYSYCTVQVSQAQAKIRGVASSRNCCAMLPGCVSHSLAHCTSESTSSTPGSAQKPRLSVSGSLPRMPLAVDHSYTYICMRWPVGGRGGDLTQAFVMDVPS